MFSLTNPIYSKSIFKIKQWNLACICKICSWISWNHLKRCNSSLKLFIVAILMPPENTIDICIFRGFHWENTYKNHYKPIKSCKFIHQMKGNWFIYKFIKVVYICIVFYNFLLMSQEKKIHSHKRVLVYFAYLQNSQQCDSG